MQITRLVLTDVEQGLLASICDSHWEHLSGERIERANFAWESVRLQTSTGAVELALDREPVEIAGDIDDYPVLRVRPAGPLSPRAEAQGRIYFQGRSETIRSIWVVRDTVVGSRAMTSDFTYIADVAIVFELESSWTVVERGSYFSDAFFIRRAPSREELGLPDTWSEWESDLLNQYTVSREWIPIA